MNMNMTGLMSVGKTGEEAALPSHAAEPGSKAEATPRSPGASNGKSASSEKSFHEQLNQQLKRSEQSEQTNEKISGLPQAAIQKPVAEFPTSQWKATPKRPTPARPLAKEMKELTAVPEIKSTESGQKQRANEAASTMMAFETKTSSTLKAVHVLKPQSPEKGPTATKTTEASKPANDTPLAEKKPGLERLNEWTLLAQMPVAQQSSSTSMKPALSAEKSHEERELKIDSTSAMSPLSHQTAPEMVSVTAQTPSTFTIPVEPTKEVAQLVAALPPQALEDASLRAALHPHVANLSIDTGEAGALSVRLMVKDGVADVQLTGPAAPIIEHRESELRVALAQEGLSLGQFDSPQRDNNPQNRLDRDDLPSRNTNSKQAPMSPSQTETVSRSSNGRVHIKA